MAPRLHPVGEVTFVGEGLRKLYPGIHANQKVPIELPSVLVLFSVRSY